MRAETITDLTGVDYAVFTGGQDANGQPSGVIDMIYVDSSGTINSIDVSTWQNNSLRCPRYDMVSGSLKAGADNNI